jgi:ABC-type nitrate/sulfonate/bicarbonate transport system substrate-binding protein
MLAGEVKAGLVDLGNIVRANLAGGDLLLVAVTRNQPNFFLVSLKEIRDIEHLRGKRVGIGQLGGPPDYTTRMVLEKNDLKPDKDVRIVQLLVGQGGRLAALQAGAIEAIVISPPLTLVAKKLGFNLLLDYSDVLPPFVVTGLATTRKYIEENPKAVENSVRAIVDAVNYILSNEEGTTKVISRYMKLTDQTILKDYYRQVALKEISRSFFPDVEAVKFFLGQERVPPGKVKPEDFIDTRFLDKLKKEGYF